MRRGTSWTSSRARRRLQDSGRRLIFVSAFVACSTPRGLGLLPTATHPTALRRWKSTTTAFGRRHAESSGSSSSRHLADSVGRGIRMARRRRESTLMAAQGAAGGSGDGRQRPGKGTQVVLLRHGMSTFNKLNIFTGWCDVPLTEEGRQEALEAGKLLAAAGFRFDVAHASVLKRACTSLHRLLDGCGQPYVPVKTSWRLNERHYGALQGRNKATLEEAMGEVVVEWRRAYGVRPPPMTDTHPHWPLISLDSRYQGLKVPQSESLRDTANRVMEYWESDIVPDIRAGKRVIVVAHANTLRSLVKRLDDVEEDAIRNVNIPTGEPFVYDFDADLKPIGEPDEYGFRGRFVGDLMAEKDAAVNEYKRREEACHTKWEENPEAVPEECWCVEDLVEESDNPAQLSSPPPPPVSSRFGEDQASLGLDRYSVGYDLPLPPMRESIPASVGGDPTARVAGGSVLEDVGGLLVETMKDLVAAGGAGARAEVEEGSDRNQTVSSSAAASP
ncbi:unnamed protein product [Ectocarpus sp. 4 AP-2014]